MGNYLIAVLNQTTKETNEKDREPECVYQFARDRLNARIVNFVMVSPRTSEGSEDDLLNFDNVVSSTKDEMDSYLSDKDKSLAMLDRRPALKKGFLSKNTSLPTSAPVERLFGIAPLVLTDRIIRL